MIGVFLLGLFILCILPAGISIYCGRFDLFEPIVFYSIFVFMMGIAIFDRVYLQDPFLRHSHVVSMDFEAAFFVVSLLYFVFFLFVLIGYYIDITKLVNIPQLYPSGVSHNPSVLKKVGFVYMIFGAIFYFLLIRSALGGELLLLFTTNTPRSEIFSGSAHLRLGSNLLHIGYTIWLISILANQRVPKIWHLLPIFPLVLLFYILGGRGGALGIIVNVVIILYYSLVYGLIPIKVSGISFVKDRFHYYAKIAVIPFIGLIIGLVALITGQLRQNRAVEDAVAGVDIIRILTVGVHNDIIDNLIATIETVPEEFGYYYGTFVLRIFFNWIPRSIWPDKPVLSSGGEFRRMVLPNQSGGRPPGEIGRFYMDLGYPGIIIGALLTGLVLRYLYELLRKNGHSPVFLLIYVVGLYSVVMEGLTNNALWSLTSSIVLLTPVIVTDWWFRTREK